MKTFDLLKTIALGFLSIGYGDCSGDSRNRPQLPAQWGHLPPQSKKNSPTVPLSIMCLNTDTNYAVEKSKKPIYQKGEELIKQQINSDLGKAGILKPFDSMDLSDLHKLKLALEKKILKQVYGVQFDLNAQSYSCDQTDFENDILRKAHIEQMGPFSQFIKNKAGTELTGRLGQSESQRGNIVYTPSYILNILYDSVSRLDTVMDIGGSIGIQAFPILTTGAKVTVVDLSARDINQLEIKTPSDLQQNLITVVGKFPDIQPPAQQTWIESFTVILMSHVAHYLTGSELRKGIKEINLWLKPGGRFYFQALTPYSNPYKWRMLIAEDLRKEGVEWPGFFSGEEKRNFARENPGREVILFEENGMPDSGHPISPEIIKRELEASGFKISYINYGSFDEELAGKTYPVSYQELERYVKRLVNRIPTGEETSIRERLETMPELLALADKDALDYEEQVNDPDIPAIGLTTMETVMVIAIKS